MQNHIGGYKDLSILYGKIFNEKENQIKYENRANDIRQAIENNMWNTEKTSHKEFELYDYAYLNSSYNRILFDKIYYPDVLAQIYPILYGVIDPNSDRAEQLYFLHSYYSSPKWFKYEEGYPHMENLEAYLMCDKKEININSTKLNMKYEINMAISKILELETQEIKDYRRWNCQEAGSSIKSINIYLNKNMQTIFK